MNGNVAYNIDSEYGDSYGLYEINTIILHNILKRYP